LHGEAFCHGPLLVVGFPCLLGDEDAFRSVRPMLGVDASEWLEPLARKHGEAMRTLWLMHEPPRGTPLSVETGPIAGNIEWTDAIERYSPKLVVFGHDHHTPRYRKVWAHRLENGTLCANVGQDATLRYLHIEMDFEGAEKSLPEQIKVSFPEAGGEILA
jgi:Icc-related predicted phosphoesterase